MTGSRYLLGLIAATLCHIYVPAQVRMDTGTIFAQPISLDTLTIRSGFDVNLFIKKVKADTTFYKSFRSLHLVPYTGQYEVNIYNDQRKIKAAQQLKARQIRTEHCRKMVIDQNSITGKYYHKNGDYVYYSSALFASLFIDTNSVCNEDDVVAGMLKPANNSRIEQNKFALKQLIFNPGARIAGIPFMAARSSIFDDDESYKYDFGIRTDSVGGVACYRFEIKPKPEYQTKVIYNSIVTWFRKKDYAILARNYSVSYSTLLYDFDVEMSVVTTEKMGKLLPWKVYYNGNWHILGKKREIATFDINITY